MAQSKQKKPYADLPLVPESVLKKRHDLDDLKLKKQAADEQLQTDAARKQQNHRRSRTNSGTYVKGPNTFLANAKSRRNHEIRYKRIKKKGMMKRASNKKEMTTKEVPIHSSNNNDDDEMQDEKPEVKTITYQSNSVGANMVFVVRTREDAGAVPRLIFNVLMKFRLKKPYQGVFLKYDATTRRLLQLIEPWVIYGRPSLGMIQDLLERRSFGTVQGERVPLSDNTILERELGNEHGILCMEDVIQELQTVGDAFEPVTRFLWPFQLTCPRSKFEKEKLGAQQGKDYGDKGEEMDSYLEQML